MPLPQPKPNESQDDFVSRFLSDETAKKEFPDHKQRIAVALNIWRRRKKHRSHSMASPLYTHSDYVMVESVPVMDEHYIVKCPKCGGKDGSSCSSCNHGHIDISVEDYENSPTSYEVILHVNKETLERIAENMNRRSSQTNDYAAITIGHTSPHLPETQQPPLVGFAKNFRVIPIRETANSTVYALAADFFIRKDHEDVLLKYPRKSVEYHIEDNIVDPIALLGASTPARQVGWIAFSGNKPTVMRYSSMSSDATTLNKDSHDDVTSIKAELESLKKKYEELSAAYEQMKKTHDDFSKYVEQFRDKCGTTEPNKDEPSDKHMTVPGPSNTFVPQFEDYKKLQNELNTLRQQHRNLSRRYRLEKLHNSEGIEFDVEEELKFTDDMTDEQFERYVNHAILKRYSRKPSTPLSAPFIAPASAPSNDNNDEELDNDISFQNQVASYALRNRISYQEARAKILEMRRSGQKTM